MHLWNGVTEFVVVAEKQSFTLAAKQLQISIAQVSRQISALENRLNIKLLHRTTRKVSLTESGETYYRYCRRILNDLAEAEKITTGLHQELRGNIRITMPVTYGEEVIIPIINDFLVEHPGIKMDIYLSNHTVDLLNDGFDLAIRLGQLKDSIFVAQKLTARTLYVCASPDYISQHGFPSTLKELKNHNCLLGSVKHWQFNVSGKTELHRVDGRMHCNSGYGLTEAALRGIGLVQLPDYYVQQHIDSGALIVLLEKYQEPEEGIWVLYPDKDYLPRKIRKLIDFLRTRVYGRTDDDFGLPSL
ncbi:MAG: LysR substrate-binding domain-containing protein [Arenicella sp.]